MVSLIIIDVPQVHCPPHVVDPLVVEDVEDEIQLCDTDGLH